ncbi:MAG: fluoride efflux transporter CrcB [Hyphomicrobiaceae bacterium]
MHLFLLACAGGAIGAGLRHLVNMTTLRTFGLDVPWATFTVNVLGSLLMGGLVAYLLHRMPEAVAYRIFFGTGVLGGFTTFSAFSFDALTYIERGAMTIALIYILASVILSIAACLAGYLTIRSTLL